MSTTAVYGNCILCGRQIKGTQYYQDEEGPICTFCYHSSNQKVNVDD